MLVTVEVKRVEVMSSSSEKELPYGQQTGWSLGPSQALQPVVQRSRRPNSPTLTAPPKAASAGETRQGEAVVSCEQLHGRAGRQLAAEAPRGARLAASLAGASQAAPPGFALHFSLA